MKHNRTILISDHAIDRFIERFEFAGKNSQRNGDMRIAAENAVREIWHSASYMSDDNGGILFRNRDFGIDFIVRDKQITTLFPTKTGEQPENHSRTEIEMHSNKNNSRFRKHKR
jgi:hypothetical protein